MRDVHPEARCEVSTHSSVCRRPAVHSIMHACMHAPDRNAKCIQSAINGKREFLSCMPYVQGGTSMQAPPPSERRSDFITPEARTVIESSGTSMHASFCTDECHGSHIDQVDVHLPMFELPCASLAACNLACDIFAPPLQGQGLVHRFSSFFPTQLW